MHVGGMLRRNPETRHIRTIHVAEVLVAGWNLTNIVCTGDPDVQFELYRESSNTNALYQCPVRINFR